MERLDGVEVGARRRILSRRCSPTAASSSSTAASRRSWRPLGHDLADRLWSARLLADEPEAIVEAHLAYFRAGARVAITASYQATFEGFAARGLGHDAAAALMRRSVELAGEARALFRAEAAPADPGPLLVAASVGPYGAYLADGSEYRGDVPSRARGASRLPPRTAPGPLGRRAGPARLRDDPGPGRGGGARRPADGDGGGRLALRHVCRRWPPPRRHAGRGGGGARRRDARLRRGGRELHGARARGGARGPTRARRRGSRSSSTRTPAKGGTPSRGAGCPPAARRSTSRRRGTWIDAGANLVGGCCRVGPAEIAALARGLDPG